MTGAASDRVKDLLSAILITIKRLDNTLTRVARGEYRLDAVNNAGNEAGKKFLASFRTWLEQISNAAIRQAVSVRVDGIIEIFEPIYSLGKVPWEKMRQWILEYPDLLAGAVAGGCIAAVVKTTAVVSVKLGVAAKVTAVAKAATFLAVAPFGPVVLSGAAIGWSAMLARRVYNGWGN